jgi:hypothetical protein
MSHQFEIGPSVDRFRQALSARHLRFTDGRRLLLDQFLLLTETPVTLPELEGAFVTQYRRLTSAERWRLPARIMETMNILLACGLAKEIEPQPPECCSTCLHRDTITVGTKRWRCWRCGASKRLQPRFVPMNGARMRVDDKGIIWSRGPASGWSVWGRASFPEIARENFDAVLFDLDGVLTATAKLHAAAWKQTFDEFLRRRAEERGQILVPFDIGDDYRRYIDGKQRFDRREFFMAAAVTCPRKPGPAHAGLPGVLYSYNAVQCN